MSIIVDPLTQYPNAWGKFRRGSCHMSSTESEAELHAFAKQVGLKRSWFQPGRHPHYDLTPGRRAAAVKAGAKEVRLRDMLTLHYAAKARASDSDK
jgi:hypothetical protein